jgi:hypothetical protein
LRPSSDNKWVAGAAAEGIISWKNSAAAAVACIPDSLGFLLERMGGEAGARRLEIASSEINNNTCKRLKPSVI